MRIILLTVSLFPTFVWACAVPPDHLHESNVELVINTPTIVLAEAVTYTDHPDFHVPVFHFNTVEVLKGDPPD